MGNCAARLGDNKIVKTPETDWELYDLGSDRGEEHDLAAAHPEIVNELVAAWEKWAAGAGVIPWEGYGPPK
jgi:arylsulfatase